MPADLLLLSAYMPRLLEGVAITAEVCSGGSVVLTCPACGAAWEWHGAWLRRFREPDREKMRAARSNTKPSESTT